MPALDIQNLKYGIIYVCGNPKQTQNLRWFATMIAPMIRPLSIEWVETWDLDHTLLVARRFNVGNLGKYATVQLHLNRYGRSDSFSLLAAVHAFSDCLQDVMDDSEGDVMIQESDYADRNELPQGKWGSSTASLPMGEVLNDFDFNEARRDNTRVAEPPIHYEIEGPTSAVPSKQCDQDSHSKTPSLKGRLKSLRDKLRSINSDDFIRDLHKKRHDFQDDDSALDDSSLASVEEDHVVVEPLPSAKSEVLDIETEEILEFNKIESEYESDVNDLRARIVAFIAKYHQDPQQVITTMLEGKVLLGTEPSRLLVNGDLKVVLPEYDELEIKMPAMCRTLYILFMKQRKQGNTGIVLRNIDEYREELLDIYGMVKPGASDERVLQSVSNLCNPFGESLYQTISRINRCIKNVITDKELAKQYTISGTKGEEYSIALDPECMELPRAVTGC